ncbi:hypothetical protein [Myroides marinus]|uniref:hypothetical protein n=1 Tax=Myroides marinus TaxID=703342 RepID=UPI002578C328|nr:hypothetical protein [Myroides marinus]MDM1367238.1 hypothetical protein [Myroides marinus]MDM1374466.1 hypothetical protein [Myroides marinus]MDM1381621.1 hypothetical protein [Myroides marinus]
MSGHFVERGGYGLFDTHVMRLYFMQFAELFCGGGLQHLMHIIKIKRSDIYYPTF